MIYPHDNATWATTLTTGETVKISGNTHDQGCSGLVLGLMNGNVIVLLPGDRVRAFSPHELARPDGTPHITLVSGKPKTVNRPLKRQPTKFRDISLRKAAS